MKKYTFDYWSNSTQKIIKKFRTKKGLILWIKLFFKRKLKRNDYYILVIYENEEIIFESNNMVY